MCGVMLAMIIFVLELFKLPVTLNSFRSFIRIPILFLQLYRIAHHHPVVVF